MLFNGTTEVVPFSSPSESELFSSLRRGTPRLYQD
jgi:hypothetical protein